METFKEVKLMLIDNTLVCVDNHKRLHIPKEAEELLQKAPLPLFLCTWKVGDYFVYKELITNHERIKILLHGGEVKEYIKFTKRLDEQTFIGLINLSYYGEIPKRRPL